MRQAMGSPNYLKNLETLVMKMPNAKETLASRREMIKRLIETRNEMSRSAQ
jgi:hypothetical protein